MVVGFFCKLIWLILRVLPAYFTGFLRFPAIYLVQIDEKHSYLTIPT
jgi:hypothetical protein